MFSTNLMRSGRLRRLATALAIGAFAVPVAAASGAPFEQLQAGDRPAPSSPPAGTDLRSPDTRDAAQGIYPGSVSEPAVTSAPRTDLRSPDAVDAARGVFPGQVTLAAAQDLRSPDTRDLAAGYDPPAPAPQPVAATGSDGFDWPSAAIGAGILMVVALTALGAVAGVRRRRAHDIS